MVRYLQLLITVSLGCRQARAFVTHSPRSHGFPKQKLHAPRSRPPTLAASTVSDAAQWHRQRRREMLRKYGDDIRPLESKAASQNLAVPLLVLGNLTLLGLSILAGRLSLLQTVLLSVFPGSILSLWQLQILHDNLHGSMWNKKSLRLLGGIPKSRLQEATLFWGSLPCVFGYYLYLKFGHLSHHSHVGDAQQASLKQLFASNQTDFEGKGSSWLGDEYCPSSSCSLQLPQTVTSCLLRTV